MPTITGDFHGLALLKANIAKLAKVPSQASKEAAKGIDTLLLSQFVAGRDPYGRAWKPKKRGGGSPLVRTGALAASARAKPASGSGIKLGPLVSYGQFHQTGTRRMVARPILPYGGLPAKWNTVIKKAVENAIKRAMAGKGG